MKTLLKFLLLVLLSVPALAQFEVSDNDTTATTQTTRSQVKFYGGVPFRVQKAKLPRRLGFYDEILAAGASGVQQVNGIAPTGGNVNVTFASLTAKPTTASGFGITDAVTTGGSYTNPAWLVSIPFSKISSPPTTLAGYSITDAVSVSGAYSNPAWLTALAAAKITGLSTVATTGLFTDLGGKPSTLAGYNITDAASASSLALKADATAVVPYQTVSSYSALSGIAAPSPGFLKFVNVSTDGNYSETDALYYITPSGKIRKLITNKEN